jgi:hypothetical protein
MIRPTTPQTLPEPAQGKPVASAEQWLGHNTSNRRRLWERLNPLHRKQLQLLARALVLHQEKARLPDPERIKLSSALDELERIAKRIEQLLAALTSRTPPPP